MSTVWQDRWILFSFSSSPFPQLHSPSIWPLSFNHISEGTPSFLSPDGLFLFAPPQSEKDMAIFLNQVLPLKQQFMFSPTAEINASEVRTDRIKNVYCFLLENAKLAQFSILFLKPLKCCLREQKRGSRNEPTVKRDGGFLLLLYIVKSIEFPCHAEKVQNK